MSTSVVIPSRSQIDSLVVLVDTLVEQGDADLIFVFDNGYRGTDSFRLHQLAAHDQVEVIEAENQNIHTMWNRGWEAALDVGSEHVCFLNDDVRIDSDHFVHQMEVWSDPVRPLVSANYDGREVNGDEPLDGICAGRYDGTGGLAGFGFLMPTHYDYRFPHWLQWWYGDNHLLMSVQARGHTACMSPTARLTHLDGGSQTGGDWSEHGLALEADRVMFSVWVEGLRTGLSADPALFNLSRRVVPT